MVPPAGAAAIPIVLVTHDLNEARLLADRLVVIDAGQVLQRGTPDSIHRAPRNARVADLVGIHNRFHGQWLGPDPQAPGWGLLRWTPPGNDPAVGPMLRVRDKGRIPPGHAVSWVAPGDGIAVLDRSPQGTGEFDAVVVEARYLGEITLATLALPDVSGAQLRLFVSGPRRPQLTIGSSLAVRVDLELVHVIPLHGRLR